MSTTTTVGRGPAEAPVQAAGPGTPAGDLPPTDRARRRELAAFLRSRRERITPEQVGLPRGPRRRTPGLRREEVAQLAAVGVTWYTWLEQARDIHVSAQVLDAVARALLLDANERRHLFVLAGESDPTRTGHCAVVTPATLAAMRQLEPFPACVQNSRYDILAYNRTYALLLGDLDQLPREDRNVLWLSLTHPVWHEALVDREEAVRVMAGKLRASMAEHLTDPTWKHLLRRLQDASPEFCEVWQRHEVVQPDTRVKCFLNPFVGRLDLDHTSMWLGPRPGPRMVVYTPRNDSTRERLVRLHARAVRASVGEGAPAGAWENGSSAVALPEDVVEPVADRAAHRGTPGGAGADGGDHQRPVPHPVP